MEIDLIEYIHIDGTTKPTWYETLGYLLEVKGTKFFNPIECHYKYLLGQGSDEYKTCVGDDRYKEIEQCLVKHFIPRIKKYGRRIKTSYDIKHMVQNKIGGYVSNETVKFILSMYKVPVAVIDRKDEAYPINLKYYFN
ncbi:hypothetical protein SAMN02745248_01504 [Hathewaya proteolytica DSM 3090]|uniref:Uncharacterized protein n=1 Tax=Hathewaya proteolytica DSM 3090 TaxID=1121331 RepID=A0A1M6NUM5_9CLOT|nr:hypothetical protein [Hathewaya proteolytica]SHJ99413.1 hypothetical protein SAMN02745248_01504 [Hathewaya proteolytica DSM 3090]